MEEEQTANSALADGGIGPEARGEDIESVSGYSRRSIPESSTWSSSRDYTLSREALAEGNPAPIPYGIIQQATNSFDEKMLLGSGGFGKVYRAKLQWQGSDVDVAVKKLDAASVQGDREFIAEVKNISQLRHRNVVKLFGWCCEGDSRLVVYELAGGGSLDNYVGSQYCLNWHQRSRVIQSIIDGLLYLHEHAQPTVIHRDIKPSNIMLKSGPEQGTDAVNIVAMFGDFGLSRTLKDGQLEGNTRRAAGTLGYMAPEALRGVFTCETDIFSLGIVILEIVSGKKRMDKHRFEHRPDLVERVERKFRSGALLTAVDSRILGAMDTSMRIKAKRVLKLGLWCSHPEPKSRPSIRVVRDLLSNTDRIYVPSSTRDYAAKFNVPVILDEVIDLTNRFLETTRVLWYDPPKTYLLGYFLSMLCKWDSLTGF